MGSRWTLPPLVKSFDHCPACRATVELRSNSAGAGFVCPSCGCGFRHNRRKWLVALPLAGALALVLLYFTRDTIIPPIFIGFVAVPLIALFVLRRIPSYVITPTSDATPKV